MLTRKDIPRLLSAGLKTNFDMGFKEPTTIYQSITTEIPSNKEGESYGWLGETNGLKEWKDERVPHALLENGFSLKNKDYEDTIAVDRNALDDEQYGQIKLRVRNMGTVAKQSYDEILAEVIEENGICYDGQNFFDTDHEEGESGVQSNVDNALPFGASSLKTIITRMKGFKMSNGKKAKVRPSHLMVPSTLAWEAREILDPKVVSVTTDPGKALMKGVLEFIENSELSDANGADAAYYVLDLKSRAVKPFIFQNRKKITFTALDKSDSTENFMRKKIYYGVEARFAFGYGDWRLAYRASGV